MSNLPHPLGDTNPGDLFYPGTPSVTVADVPGAAGSRAVEFGEDGYSLAVNRGLYAMGKNVEYVQARMETKVPKTSFTAFTPAGGNGNQYTVAAESFVGDDAFLPETQDSLNALISVLDEYHNELIDPTTGAKVVVRQIRDAGDAGSAVGSVWETGAIVRFGLADIVKQNEAPGGGAVTPYTIPDGTNVLLCHGLPRTLDTLATSGSEHLLRSGWMDSGIRGASEIHASSFLRDGSRPALDDFNMDGHDIINIGPSQFALGDLPALFTALSGNRTLAKDGAITFDDPTGRITLPANMTVSLNGTPKTVGGQFIDAADGVLGYGVIDSTGTFVERSSAQNILSTDVPVCQYYWLFSGPSFSSALDLRWATNGFTGAQRMTVSDIHPNADFDNLQDALNVAAYFLSYRYGGVTSYLVDAPNHYVIEILDHVLVTETVVVPGNAPGLIICGAQNGMRQNFGRSDIEVQMATLTDNVIWCQGRSVCFENLCFNNQGSALTDGYMIHNLGSGSWIKNVSAGGLSFFYSGVSLYGSQDILIENFSFIPATGGYGVTTSTYSSGTNVVLRDCFIRGGWGVSAVDIRFQGDLLLDHCNFTGGWSASAAVVGPGARVQNCYFAGSANGGVEIWNDAQSASFYPYFYLQHPYTIRDCSFSGVSKAIKIAFTLGLSRDPMVNVEGCQFHTGTYAIWVENSASSVSSAGLRVSGCRFYNNSTGSIYLDTAKNVTIEGCQWHNMTSGTPIRSIQHNRLTVSNCIFASVRSPTLLDAAIYLEDSSSGDEEVVISDCIFTGNGGATAPTGVYVDASHVTVQGCHFGKDSGNPEIGVYMVSGKGNQILNNNFRKIIDKSVYIDMRSAPSDHGWVEIRGNYFNPPSDVVGVASVYILGTPGCRIVNNQFIGDRTDFDQKGTAIWANDLTRGIEDTIVEGNQFVDIIGDTMPSTSAVVFLQGDSYYPGGMRVNNNTFVNCGNVTAAAIDSRIIDVVGKSFEICGNLIKNSYGPQSSSGYQRLIYVTNDVFGHCFVNNNVIEEDSTNTAGRITLGRWYGVSSSSIGVEFCNNKFHTTNDLGITANGVDEVFIYLPGGHISHNFMGVRSRNTITGLKYFIYYPAGGGYKSIGNVCQASHHNMYFAGDYCVIQGNIMTFDLAPVVTTIVAPGDQSVMIGNYCVRGVITFAGAGGIAIGNHSGGGVTNTGSHTTSGNI